MKCVILAQHKTYMKQLENDEYVPMNGFLSLLWTLTQKGTCANKAFTAVSETTCLHISTSLSTLLCKLSVGHTTWTPEGCFPTAGNCSSCSLSCHFLVYSAQTMENLYSAHCFWLGYFLDFCSPACSSKPCTLSSPKAVQGEAGSWFQHITS